MPLYARERLVDAQPAFGGFVIEIEQQDALQAVEGKTFPQFDVEQGGKLDRMAEKGLRRGGLGHGFSVALFFCLRPSESAASAQPKHAEQVFQTASKAGCAVPLLFCRDEATGRLKSAFYVFQTASDVR